MRSKAYALCMLALLMLGGAVSVMANNGDIVAPRPKPGPGSSNAPGPGFDSPPTPVSPPCGSKGQSQLPELIVESSLAEMYNFQVYRGDTRELVAEAYTTEPNWVVTPVGSGLAPGIYSWTCRANAGGWSEYFDPYWTFTVEMPDVPAFDPVDPPIPLRPQSGSKGGNPNPELVVLGPVGAELYHFRVHRDETNDLIAEAYTADPAWIVTTITHGLPTGDYSWTCRVNFAGMWSEFFQPFWTFGIQKYVPPADGIGGEERQWTLSVKPRVIPNPFGNTGTRIRLTLPRDVAASAAVYTSEGRLVRRLNLVRGAGGLVEISWNGRDETGRSAGAGTYLCQITAGDMHKVVELIKSR
jgi:hypothetical protein